MDQTRPLISFRPISLADSQTTDWAARLRQAHYDVQEIPLLEIVAAPQSRQLCTAALELASDSWLVFTSQNAARVFLQACPPRTFPAMMPRIACLAKDTASPFHERSIVVDFVGQTGDADAFAAELLNYFSGRNSPQRLCFLRGRLASLSPQEKLRSGGHEVFDYVVYDSIPRKLSDDEMTRLRLALAHENAVLLFTNAASVRAVCESCDSWGLALSLFQARRAAAIGGKTAAELKEKGFTVSFLPERPSLENLVSEILESSVS